MWSWLEPAAGMLLIAIVLHFALTVTWRDTRTWSRPLRSRNRAGVKEGAAQGPRPVGS